MSPRARRFGSGYRRRLNAADRRLWRTFVVAHNRIEQALEDELRVEHGLELAAVEVLYELMMAPDNKMRMADLANNVVYTRSGLSRLVNRLAERGLIERESVEHDARGVYACLTEAGYAKFMEAIDDHVAVLRKHFFDIVGDDADALEEILTRLAAD